MPAVSRAQTKAFTFLERIQEASKELRTWEIKSNEANMIPSLNSVKTLISQEPQQATAFNNGSFVAGGQPPQMPFSGFGVPTSNVLKPT